MWEGRKNIGSYNYVLTVYKAKNALKYVFKNLNIYICIKIYKNL